MTPRILPALERLGRLTLNRRGHVSRFVSTPVGRVHVYDAWGHGQLPAVIFIHGIGTAAPPFAPVLARLRHHVRRVVALELPGHGASDQPSRQLTPEVLFEATGAALDHLIEQPSVLVGNSLGGAVAMHYAMERPENVRGLFLVSPAGARIEEHELETLVRNFDIRTSDDARVRRSHLPPRAVVPAPRGPRARAAPHPQGGARAPRGRARRSRGRRGQARIAAHAGDPRVGQVGAAAPTERARVVPQVPAAARQDPGARGLQPLAAPRAPPCGVGAHPTIPPRAVSLRRAERQRRLRVDAPPFAPLRSPARRPRPDRHDQLLLEGRPAAGRQPGEHVRGGVRPACDRQGRPRVRAVPERPPPRRQGHDPGLGDRRRGQARAVEQRRQVPLRGARGHARVRGLRGRAVRADRRRPRREQAPDRKEGRLSGQGRAGLPGRRRRRHGARLPRGVERRRRAELLERDPAHARGADEPRHSAAREAQDRGAAHHRAGRQEEPGQAGGLGRLRRHPRRRAHRRRGHALQGGHRQGRRQARHRPEHRRRRRRLHDGRRDQRLLRHARGRQRHRGAGPEVGQGRRRACAARALHDGDAAADGVERLARRSPRHAQAARGQGRPRLGRQPRYPPRRARRDRGRDDRRAELPRRRAHRLQRSEARHRVPRRRGQGRAEPEPPHLEGVDLRVPPQGGGTRRGVPRGRVPARNGRTARRRARAGEHVRAQGLGDGVDRGGAAGHARRLGRGPRRQEVRLQALVVQVRGAGRLHRHERRRRQRGPDRSVRRPVPPRGAARPVPPGRRRPRDALPCALGLPHPRRARHRRQGTEARRHARRVLRHLARRHPRVAGRGHRARPQGLRAPGPGRRALDGARVEQPRDLLAAQRLGRAQLRVSQLPGAAVAPDGAAHATRHRRG
ncbi:MAG: alpha/beta fold hydrolase [Myxococcales bacterium]|nr:alpha/beta fold hydrolase [Myxococcales bacterium]